jgi:hypothetical protein
MLLTMGAVELKLAHKFFSVIDRIICGTGKAVQCFSDGTKDHLKGKLGAAEVAKFAGHISSGPLTAKKKAAAVLGLFAQSSFLPGFRRWLRSDHGPGKASWGQASHTGKAAGRAVLQGPLDPSILGPLEVTTKRKTR